MTVSHNRKPVVVGVDGSPAALQAVRWLAAARDAANESTPLRADRAAGCCRPPRTRRVRSLVLGSTSQHLLHHSACPVAVVRND